MFTPAPAGTFFNGQENSQWLNMMDEHCQEVIEVPTTAAPTRRPQQTAAPVCYGSSGDRADTVTLEPEIDYDGWGNSAWGEAQYCPGSSFVRSVRVKVQEFQGDGEEDDTGVNGIEFTCSDGCVINSSVGPYGSYAESKTCPGTNDAGFVDKVTFKTTPGLGGGLGASDNTAVDGFRWCCTVGWGWTQTINGETGGTWKTFSACPTGYAFYGLQTKINASPQDNKGLVNARFFCAPV